MFQHVSDLEGLVQISHGRAEPRTSRTSRGERGAAVGMPNTAGMRWMGSGTSS